MESEKLKARSSSYFDKGHAEAYVSFRPRYTDEVYSTIYQYCDGGTRNGEPFEYGLAVDVGCGSGQATIPLCNKFRKVIGCDLSTDQIGYAEKYKRGNLSFVVSAGENLDFLQPNSVDLITTAVALHWMNMDAFFKEAYRVLKPGGVIATYGYSSPTLDIQAVNDEYLQLIYGTLQDYWEPCSFLSFEGLKDVSLPIPGFIRVPFGKMSMAYEYTVDEFIGFITSCHGWRTYEAHHPGCLDLIQLSEKRLGPYNLIKEDFVETKLR